MKTLARSILTSAVFIFCANVSQAQTTTTPPPTCSAAVKSGVARLLASREIAGTKNKIAEANLALEKENQARITAAMEQEMQKTLTGANSFVPSVQASIKAALEKTFVGLRKLRAQQSAALIKAKEVQAANAQRAFTRAFNAVRTPSCTL